MPAKRACKHESTRTHRATVGLQYSRERMTSIVDRVLHLRQCLQVLGPSNRCRTRHVSHGGGGIDDDEELEEWMMSGYVSPSIHFPVICVFIDTLPCPVASHIYPDMPCVLEDVVFYRSDDDDVMSSNELCQLFTALKACTVRWTVSYLASDAPCPSKARVAT